MCKNCENLVKQAHVAYIAKRGAGRTDIGLVEVGAAAFYDSIIARAAKNSREFMKRIDAGKPQIVTQADFALAQMMGEQSAIEFMFSYTGKAVAKMELAATKEIEQLRIALTLIQSQATLSGDDKLKKIAEEALSHESKFTQSSKDLEAKIAQSNH